MGKTELGTKYTCHECGARFYDLNKSPVLCLKCGAEQLPKENKDYASSKSKKSEREKNLKKVDHSEEVEVDVDDIESIEDPIINDGDQDEDLMEDTSDLGGNDEAILGVKEQSVDDLEK